MEFFVYNEVSTSQAVSSEELTRTAKEMFSWAGSVSEQYQVDMFPDRQITKEEKDKIFVINKPKLHYSNSANQEAVESAAKWSDLAGQFRPANKTLKYADPTFPKTTRWESVYPPEAWVKVDGKYQNPSEYTVTNGEACFPALRIHDPQLLCNDGYAWTPFHYDNPPLETYSQLLQGRKVWFVLARGRVMQNLLRAANQHSFVSWWTELKTNGLPAGMKVLLQMPGQTLHIPVGCWHGVLSDKGWTNMLTWQITSPDEDKNRQLLESYRPGAKHIKKAGPSKRRSRFGRKRAKPRSSDEE